jgi:RNA polymerase sigma-70 factor (sigma-E family)
MVQDSLVSTGVGGSRVSDSRVEARTAESRADESAETVDAAPATAPTTFGECYRDLRPEMVRLAALLTGSSEIAQDLVQDAFVRLHGQWSRVHEPRAYLRRAVVNACHSHHRRRRVERRYASTADAVANATLEANELADALDALPHRQRAAIVLRFYADLSDIDIAAALRCRPGTVASLIHRGLEQLRRVIER